jgi:hypothetical protein
MGWVLVLGFLAGLALGVRYHKEIMSLIATAEARVAILEARYYLEGIKGGERKIGVSRSTQGLYEVTEEIRSMGATSRFPITLPLQLVLMMRPLKPL